MEQGASAEYMIWFLRKQALWCAALHVAGDTLRVGTAQRIARLSYKPGRWLTLAVAANGRWASIDDGTGQDRDHPGSLNLIETQPRVTVRRLARITFPSFAPDSKQLAVTRLGADGESSVAILDLATNRWRTLLPHASQPFWSADGREIALIREEAGTDTGLVVDAHNGKTRYQSCPTVSLTEPILSPDGRFFATLCAISRPKLGHTITDRRTGKALLRQFDWPKRLPAALYDWSPDGRWLAWNWRVPDPENEGTWLRDEVGLVSAHPGVCRWVDVGNQAAFSPDSQYLLWRRPDGLICATRVGPRAAQIQFLLSDVETFAIR